MKIWLNSPFDPLPGEGGRLLRYGLLSRALVAAGHQVVWWSSDFHHIRKARRALASVYEAEGVQIRLVPTRPYRSNVGWRRWRSHMAYAATWERLARGAVAGRELAKPDCLVTSLPPLGLFDPAARLREAWGCRVVVDIQDAWPETFYQLLPRAVRLHGECVFGRLHEVAARAYRGADQVSAVCERYAVLAQARGCQSTPQVFRLGCQLPDGAWLPRPASRVLRLCYVGNLGTSYDIRTMVSGVCELADEGVLVTLDVAGDGAQWGWVAGVAANGPSPVRFHGYLDDAELQACLRGADVGVVPMSAASWVAVPNKVVDYAAFGLAMVNGLTGETADLLARFDAGICYRVGDVASFKQAVRRYAADGEALARHQVGARRLAEAHFDEREIYPQMARWLEGKF